MRSGAPITPTNEAAAANNEIAAKAAVANNIFATVRISTFITMAFRKKIATEAVAGGHQCGQRRWATTKTNA